TEGGRVREVHTLTIGSVVAVAGGHYLHSRKVHKSVAVGVAASGMKGDHFLSANTDCDPIGIGQGWGAGLFPFDHRVTEVFMTDNHGGRRHFCITAGVVTMRVRVDDVFHRLVSDGPDLRHEIVVVPLE